MAEKNTGLRSLLLRPSLYNAAQRAIGGDKGRRHFVHHYLSPEPGQRILDIGCGTGAVLGLIGAMRVEYVGIDPSPAYIDEATRRYPDADFRVGELGNIDNDSLGRFDRVVMKGVLHHISDDLVHEAAKVAAEVLKPGGIFASMDPCFTEGQSWISRQLVSRDRGQNVRHASAYRDLVAADLPSAELHQHSDFLRVPYNHAVVRAVA